MLAFQRTKVAMSLLRKQHILRPLFLSPSSPSNPCLIMLADILYDCNLKLRKLTSAQERQPRNNEPSSIVCKHEPFRYANSSLTSHLFLRHS